MINTINTNNHTIKAILKVEERAIVRYFSSCLEYTRYLKNNKNLKVVNARRFYS